MICLAEGLIESQIDHLKRVQTKLTLFSLQSDRCVSKVREIYWRISMFLFSRFKDEILIDECVQVLSVLNNLAYDCVDVKVNPLVFWIVQRNDRCSSQDILSSSGLVPFLHQLWCWAIVDVQLLNVILLLLTTLTAKHRKGRWQLVALLVLMRIDTFRLRECVQYSPPLRQCIRRPNTRSTTSLVESTLLCSSSDQQSFVGISRGNEQSSVE